MTETRIPVLVPDRNSASGMRVEWLSIEVDANLAKTLESCIAPPKPAPAAGVSLKTLIACAVDLANNYEPSGAISLIDDASPAPAVAAEPAMIRDLINFVSGIRQKFIDPETRNDLLNKIGSYSLPVQPGAGEREALESCKGEQQKFEEWAARERYDMAEHPLHYLFLNEKTYAARQGWKAALEYARSVLSRQAPHSSSETGS